MAQEIRLPDIGDFKDVPIIEILIAPGQSVRKEATILTLESDKATLDVPAPEDGVIGEIHVKVGDRVSQGSLLATYAGAAADQPAATPAACRAASAAASAAPAAAPPPRLRPADFEAEVLVFGAGPGGYTAAFRAADLGQKVVLVDRRRDARRRLPQRRLHSLEGAPACRQDHRRGGGDGGAWRKFRPLRRSISPRSATGRTGSSSV